MATLIGLLIAVGLEKAGLIWASADKLLQIKKGNWLSERLESFVEEQIEKDNNLNLGALLALAVIVVLGLSFLLNAGLGFIGQGIFAGAVLFWTLGEHHWDKDESPYIAAHEQYFAPLFWFALLGVLGAVAYWILRLIRGLWLEQKREQAHPAWVISHGVMAWLPARITGLLFALVGNFITGFGCWQKGFKYQTAQSGKFLDDCGQAALEVEHGDEPTMMINRTLVFWVIFASLIALFIEFI